MGFYAYFKMAKLFCPPKLKPFAPAIYYEVARQLERYDYPHLDNFYVTGKMLESVYHVAYDRIVERIGEQIAKDNYLHQAEKYVGQGDQQTGCKER